MIKWFCTFILLVFVVFSGSAHASDDEAIDFVKEEGIMNGYPDGSFRLIALLNRAEFVKVLVEAVYDKNPQDFASPCFADVKKSDWFAGYVCFAKKEGLINGYDDGGFYPARQINLAEVSKVIVKAFDFSVPEVGSGAKWYEKYVKALTLKFYIPDSFDYFGQTVQRGQIAEMLYRIVGEAKDRPYVAYDELKAGVCVPLGEDLPSNIDMEKVRDTWLGWYNTVRAENGLEPYSYNIQLHRTAIVWSETAESRGFINHKREGQTAYYDYAKILQWFKDLGVTFKSHGATFTENIGWGPYRCTESDCTDELIKAIRYTFDFYMNEKDMAYKPHYESVMNKYFKEIGLGIAMDEGDKKVYITVHYAAEVVGAYPVCGE